MFLKPKVGDRVKCTKDIVDHRDPKTVIIRKNAKGTVVHTKGPIGIDVQWDGGFYCPIDKKDIKKI